MASEDVRADRRYTKDHEWALEEGGLVKVGITAFAVDQLGDITLVNLDVKVGDTVEEGKAFGTIESVKTLSDLFAPLSGTVESINGALENRPELVNEDCFGGAWMIAIRPADPGALASLLDAAAYSAFLASSAH